MSVELEVESVFDKTSSDLWDAIQNNKIKCLKTEDFRKTISCCRKILTAPSGWSSLLSQMSSRMLIIIASGKLSMDSQIVASTAYLMVLNVYQDPTDISKLFFEKILKVTKHCPEILGIKVAKLDNFKLSLCHGLLQLNDKFWLCSSLNLNAILFSGIFPILLELCYAYNALCFLSFRTLGIMLQKINNFPEKNSIISTQHFKQILNIVMANWENPLSGIREQNTVVFEQLLLVNENYWKFLEGLYPNIYHVVADIKVCPLLEIILVEQSWMLKSKYFLLSAIVPRYGITQALHYYGSDIISGLFLSLKFVYLVSAGTNLYYTILSGLTSQQWQSFFLPHILSAFNEQSKRIQSEHIFSYWLPHTIKKYPEVLEYLLCRVNKETDYINRQFAHVSLLRLARKEGIDIINWENLSDGPSTVLVNALQCYSEPLRSQAFEYVCTSLKTRVIPTKGELNLVIWFLKQNISADNAAFRQNMLNSMIMLLIRIRDSCLHHMRHTTDDSVQQNENLLIVFDFICRLHMFLVDNLEYGSNYQRKYTSLVLYKIILDYLGKNVSKKNTRKSNTKSDGFLISNYGEKIGKWNFTSTLSRTILFSCLLDTSDDVRNTASEILVSHFELDINDIKILLPIFMKGMSLCLSPMFFEAESGALIIKVVTTLTYKLDCKYLEEIFKNIGTERNSTVVSTLLTIAEEQTKQLMNDVLHAASQGSPVYGILTALENLLTDRYSVEFMKLTHAEQQSLISLLEDLVKFILDTLSSKSSSDTEFAPSFGEMGLAVSAVVQSSSLANDSAKVISVNEGSTNDTENFNLTPCEQLILNCMWLNIKVCCSLISGLIVSSCLDREDVVKCAQLLCLVLYKCRHKGAIESAGGAIKRAVKYLTASESSQLRAIPYDLLTQFLQTVVSTKATTVSRRSAGLAILVHQLVSADMESGKPLLHFCVTNLIKVIRSGEIPSDISLADLPQSQALHFLRTLVQDSSLRQHMALYTLDISLLCFENLSSSIWTIRNAALQLFGGLIPKLIGEKRQQQQGKEFTSGYHLAFEELFHHMKPLFELAKKELELASVDSSLWLHSKLMPILTLLCNLTVNVQSLFNTEVKQVLEDFNKHFKSLFKSDIYSVRKQSAKASAWFCFPSNLVSLLTHRIRDIIDYILFDTTICSENELHGYLLNVKYIIKRFNEEKVGMKVLLDEESEVQSILHQLSKVSAFLKKHSFISQALICSLYIDNTIEPLQCCKEIASTLDRTYISLGMPYWVNLYLTSAMQYCDTKKLANILKFCLMESEHYDLQKTIIKVLKTRDESICLAENVDDIKAVLICFINSGNTNNDIVLPVLETLLLICQKVGSNSIQNTTIERSIYNNILFDCQLGNKCSSVMLPVLCACIDSNTVSVDMVRSIICKIRMNTDPENNEDVRLNTAESLKFIFPVLGQLKDSKFHDETGYDLWQSTVNLLQDQDYDIRLEASKFVSSLIVSNQMVQNPYMSLQLAFKHEVLQLFMSEIKIIKCLWSKLKYNSEFCHSTKELNINPFDHGHINNIYEEENIVLDFVTNSLVEILATCNTDVFIQLINSDLSEVQMQCTKMLNCIKSDKTVSYIMFKKNLAQLKICIKIQNSINELQTLYNDLEKLKYHVFKM